MSKTKYYKLGAKASNFWDPSQSEEDNKKLTLGQVKALEPTKHVNQRVASGGLVIVEKEEYDDYQDDLKKLKGSSVKKGLSKTVKEANLKTEVAVKAKDEAESNLKEANDANETLVGEAEIKDAELVELRAKVAALEAGDDTGGESGEGDDK